MTLLLIRSLKVNGQLRLFFDIVKHSDGLCFITLVLFVVKLIIEILFFWICNLTADGR